MAKKTENSIQQKIERMKDRSHSEPKTVPENIRQQEKNHVFHYEPGRKPT